jgi:hypothetical protein
LAGGSKAGLVNRSVPSGRPVCPDLAAAAADQHYIYGLPSAQGATLSGRARRHSRAWHMGTRAEHDSGVHHRCARQKPEQTSGAAERTALLRIARHTNGVHELDEVGPQVSLLPLPECATEWRAVCPAKSLPAQAIEESVLGRIREGSSGIFEVAVREQMDRTRQVQAIQAIV